MNATTEWLPGDPPASGAGEYFRLKDLKTYKDRTADLRVLCPFIHGWEVWVKDGKPVRAQEREALPPSDEWRVENGKRNEPKPFWAAFVWNHVNGKVQVFAFTQGSIYGQIKTLVENRKWGALSDYDLTIKSKGEGLETEYSVTPNPKEPLPEAAVAAWKDVQETAVGLAALYVGGNPLSAFGE